MRAIRLNSDTPAHRAQVWISFVISAGATSIGIFFLDVDVWSRAFIVHARPDAAQEGCHSAGNSGIPASKAILAA
ncbi:MAG: hypothetical protein GY822_20815 [Deltaproteobacteria bacterium]|nr:hypothetical protein [Deltaproteobacteria bacterium]